MAQFTIIANPLPGLAVVQRHRSEDQRGFFGRLYCSAELAGLGLRLPIAQINHSFTRRRGAVRGLHFQRPPYAEDKFVTCLRGEVFDVAVDLRRGSGTFLKWHGERLSGDNARSILIPQGFAHGFQALSDDCELLYLHTCAYALEAEGAVNARDPAVGIDWPLPFTDLSVRDAGHEFLTPDFGGI